MQMPEDSNAASKFVVVVSYNSDNEERRSTFVFDPETTLSEIFGEVFSEGRKGLLGTILANLPHRIELYPDLSSLPRPKSLNERYGITSETM